MSLASLSATDPALLERARDNLEIWTGLEQDRNPHVPPTFDTKLWSVYGSLKTVGDSKYIHRGAWSIYNK